MGNRVFAWFVWGVWLLLGVGLIVGGVQELRRQGGGTPGEATVTACEVVNRSVTCTGSWVVGGDLIGGNGRVVVGTIDGAGRDDVDKTIAVQLSADGEDAFVPSPATAVGAIGIGVLMLAATGLLFIRVGSGRLRPADGSTTPFRKFAPSATVAGDRWKPPGRLGGASLVVRRPLTLLLVLAVPASFIGLASIASSSDRGPLVLLGVLFSVLVFAVASGLAAARATYTAFAAREGLEFAGRSMPPPFGLPRMPRQLRGYEHALVYAVFRGAIAHGPTGLLAPTPTVRGYRYARAEPALALYELDAGGGALAGRTFVVRVQDGAAVVESERDAEAARPLLDPAFAAWLVADGPAALEISDGWLFVQAARPYGSDYAGLEAFARRAARVAAHVREAAAARTA